MKKYVRVLGSVILLAYLAWSLNWREVGEAFVASECRVLAARGCRVPHRPGGQQRALAHVGPSPGL